MEQKKVVIAAALTGGQIRKERAPALPLTPAEIAADAVVCDQPYAGTAGS